MDERRPLALVLAALALSAPACGEDGSVSAGGESAPAATSSSEPEPKSEPTPTVEGLSEPVSRVRAELLAAAEEGDYGRLRPLLDPSVFLSDFGFGDDVADPVGRWEAMGPAPLETIGALLRMPHVVRETNEGTLYEWPRFDADSKSADDVSEPERKLFLSFMTEEELDRTFLPELGYTGPRLGILANGTWWFFILEGED